jgi:excisionase family DNA binding protein
MELSLQVDETLYTIEEVAAQLRTSRSTLYRLVRDGAIPYRKIGKKAVQFTAADIQEIIESARYIPHDRKRDRS